MILLIMYAIQTIIFNYRWQLYFIEINLVIFINIKYSYTFISLLVLGVLINTLWKKNPKGGMETIYLKNYLN